MRLGFVVNPVAGMGGRVGLKGTDGKVAEARERGGEPRAPARARRTLVALRDRAPEAEILTWDGAMGADAAREAGFEPTVLGAPGDAPADAGSRQSDDEETTAADTRAAVAAFVDAGVDLVLFVGGDGTAADVAEALEAAGSDVPMLGSPAGVKVFSSVFAISPEDAATVATTFERVERREVLDIDEDDYREGEVNPELRAVARVPVAEDLQSSKQLGGGSVESLVAGFVDDVESGVTYVLGPGSTVGAIKEALGFDGSPLGVDVWRATPVDDDPSGDAEGERRSWRGEVLALDASEDEILNRLGERNVVVVSPIGGQGFVFGRGNLPLSPAVLSRCEVEIVASPTKLDGLGELHVDTDDPDLDERLRGWTRVRVGRFERRMMKVT